MPSLRDIRLELSPASLVLLVASLVVGTVIVARLLMSGDSGRVSAYVPYQYAPREDSERAQQSRQIRDAKLPDGEVIRTANRVQELIALNYVLQVKLATDRIHNRRVPKTVKALLDEVTQAGLLHPGLKYVPDRLQIASLYGTLFVRYQPQPEPALEIIHLGRVPIDGPALMMRAPDLVENRYFQSTDLEGIRVPPPFTPAALVIAAGWTTESLPAHKVPENYRREFYQLTRNPEAALLEPAR